MTIPLFTSVAPSMSRQDENGAEIGAAYQEACIRSWIAAGFRVVSVNGPDDDVPFQDMMEVVRTTRTAKDLHGKPVVFVADLFAAAARVTSGPAAIINADILLRPSFDFAARVAGLRQDQALIARRTDLARLADTGGAIYEGFDLFAAHVSRLAQIPDRTFAVGLHWWDYIVPLELDALGVRVETVAKPLAYHLLHGKNWNQKEWFNLGVAFAERVQQLPVSAATEALRPAALAVTDQHTKAEPYRPIIKFAAGVHSNLGARVKHAAERKTAKALRRLAAISFRAIDTAFSPHPAQQQRA
jgi:hypothetical protein